MTSRPATSGDHAAIERVVNRAFHPNEYESKLLTALRAADREVLEWVVLEGGQILAHIAYTRAYREHEVIGWHLAPVAVDPDFQNRGLGTLLITATLKDDAIQAQPVFVLGAPAYYRRFGFIQVTAPACPFDPSNEHFQALRWTSSAEFVIGYEPEFHHA